jgi:methionine-rich copper-binding protein CopC
MARMRALSPMAAFVIAAACALALVLVVFAHAEPARVSPGSGAVVVEPPAEVVIEMSQEMHREEGKNDIDVFTEAGVEVTAVSAVVDNGNRRLLSVLMPGTLEPGIYTVRWKTLSADDGDEAAGEYQFTYDPNGVADPGVEDVREDPLPPAESPTAPPGSVIVADGGDGGVTWVLVAAVGVGMLTLGSGVTFLLVQKRG